MPQEVQDSKLAWYSVPQKMQVDLITGVPYGCFASVYYPNMSFKVFFQIDRQNPWDYLLRACLQSFED